MTGRELYNLYKVGSKIVLRFKKEIEDFDCQFNEGMFAVLKDISLDDETITITVDETEFSEINKNLEKSDWRTDINSPFIKKYSEIYNRVNIFTVYDELDSELCNVEVISSLELTYEYLESKTKLNYTEWLETLVKDLRK